MNTSSRTSARLVRVTTLSAAAAATFLFTQCERQQDAEQEDIAVKQPAAPSPAPEESTPPSDGTLETLQDDVLTQTRIAGEKLDQASKTATAKAGEVWQVTKERAAVAGRSLRETTAQTKEKLKAKGGEALQEAKEKAGVAWEASKEKATAVTEITKEKATEAWESAKKTAETATGVTTEKAGELWETVQETSGSGKERAGALLEAVKTGASLGAEILKEKADTLLKEPPRETEVEDRPGEP